MRSVVLFGVVVAVGTGCIESALVPCGEQLCPVRSVCVADMCVDTGNLAACADLADGETCTSDNVVAGVCRGGACFPRGCGNGIVEPGEACDDGNREFGDGCAADCISTERCGNGVLDFSEECEDGGLRSADGCSSTCRREQPGWTYAMPPPANLSVAAAVFDVRRQRMIVTGSRPGQARETWEMDRDGVWTLLVGAATAQPVLGSPMVYDLDRDRVVVFNHSSTGSTWVFDGAQWGTLATPSPPGRTGHAMTYDRTNRRVVMFGGLRSNVARNDTWVLEGDAWRELFPPVRPDARYNAGQLSAAGWLAFDPVRSTAVLTGGTTGDALLIDAWEFDGMTWKEIPAPQLRLQAQLVFDSARQRAMLPNGHEIYAGYSPTMTEWAGTHWESYSINDLFYGPAVYDPFRRGILCPGTGAVRGGVLRWSAPNEELDSCSGLDDLDRDGLVGCTDPDCFGYCDPLCPPGATCPATRPRCGDGACDAAWETAARCPGDCP